MTMQPGVAWIIGGGSGIGAAVAQLLAQRGWMVAISGRREDKLAAVAEGHPTISAYPLDVTDAAAIESTVQSIAADLGRVDLFIFGAAAWQPMDVGDYDFDKFAKIVDTNYLGVARLANPVWHIHAGRPPESGMVVSFATLLNLASVVAVPDKATLWGFIRRYAPEASPATNPQMDEAAGFAVRYYNDFVKPEKTFRAPTDLEREALEDLRAQLAAYDGPFDDEALQSIVYACGRDRFEPLRDWFKALYEVLLGASQGPRFGGFIALYGVNETIALIDKGLAGELV